MHGTRNACAALRLVHAVSSQCMKASSPEVKPAYLLQHPGDPAGRSSTLVSFLGNLLSSALLGDPRQS